MANKKITELNIFTSLENADVFVSVDNSASETKQISWANILANVTALANLTITESQISDLGSYLSNISEDTTPALGGNLDAGAFNITNVGAVDGRDLSTDGAKLDLIEANADVTDATNVNNAGATMNTDTDVSSNSWVLDEDTMSSDSNTKVPTQQSVKAYVDANAGGGGETAVWESAPVFFEGTGVSLTSSASGGTVGTLSMTDGNNNQLGYYSFRVPSGGDGLGISKIEILYENLATSSSNIYFNVRTTHYDYLNGGARTQDTTGTSTTSATPTTSGQTGIITAPASSFDSIPNPLSEGDIITVAFGRNGAEASDTYSNILRVLGVMITFA